MINVISALSDQAARRGTHIRRGAAKVGVLHKVGWLALALACRSVDAQAARKALPPAWKRQWSMYAARRRQLQPKKFWAPLSEAPMTRDALE